MERDPLCDPLHDPLSVIIKVERGFEYVEVPSLPEELLNAEPCIIKKQAKSAAQRTREFRQRQKEKKAALEALRPGDPSTAKTSSQRSKEYRQRQKELKLLGKRKKVAQSNAQRSKAYRERLKLRKKLAEAAQHFLNPEHGTHELNVSKKKPKSAAQRNREYRERLKLRNGCTKKLKKTASEIKIQGIIETENEEMLIDNSSFTNFGVYIKEELEIEDELQEGIEKVPDDITPENHPIASPTSILKKNVLQIKKEEQQTLEEGLSVPHAQFSSNDIQKRAGKRKK